MREEKNHALADLVDDGLGTTRALGLVWFAFLFCFTLAWSGSLAAFLARFLELRHEAAAFAPYWERWGILLVGTFTAMTMARVLYARACIAAKRGTRLPISVRPLAMLGALQVGLAFEVLAFFVGFTLLPLPIIRSLQTLAVARHEDFSESSPFGVWRQLAKGLQAKYALGLECLAGLATLIVIVNVIAAAFLATSLVGAFPGLALGEWYARLTLENPRVWLAGWAVGTALAAPLRIGAFTSLVFSGASQTTGEDLQAWLVELKEKSA